MIKNDLFSWFTRCRSLKLDLLEEEKQAEKSERLSRYQGTWFFSDSQQNNNYRLHLITRFDQRSVTWHICSRNR